MKVSKKGAKIGQNVRAQDGDQYHCVSVRKCVSGCVCVCDQKKNAEMMRKVI